jgi:uncharacterized protein
VPKVQRMIVDFCAYLGDWPTYQLPYRTADGLISLMDRCGIDAACVSLAGGMFRFDAREANEELTGAIAAHRDRLWPIGTLDPTIPTWEEDLDDGLDRLGLAGFRLHPTYHGYALGAPDVVRLATELAGARRPLFVALQVDEERYQHPAIRVPNVPIAEIAELIRQAPHTTLVLNNLKVEHALSLLGTGLDQNRVSQNRVFMDVNAMDMPFDALRSLVEAQGAGRLVFGSQMPFLYPEAALMLVAHAGLSIEEREAILERNWQLNPVLARMAPGGPMSMTTREDNRNG